MLIWYVCVLFACTACVPVRVCTNQYTLPRVQCTLIACGQHAFTTQYTHVYVCEFYLFSFFSCCYSLLLLLPAIVPALLWDCCCICTSSLLHASWLYSVHTTYSCSVVVCEEWAWTCIAVTSTNPYTCTCPLYKRTHSHNTQKHCFFILTKSLCLFLFLQYVIMTIRWCCVFSVFFSRSSDARERNYGQIANGYFRMLMIELGCSLMLRLTHRASKHIIFFFSCYIYLFIFVSFCFVLFFLLFIRPSSKSWCVSACVCCTHWSALILIICKTISFTN